MTQVVINKLKTIQETAEGTDFFELYKRLKPIIIRQFGEKSEYFIEISKLLDRMYDPESSTPSWRNYQDLISCIQRMIDDLEISTLETRPKTPCDFWDLVHPKVKEIAEKRFEAGFPADAIVACLKEANSILKKHVRSEIDKELDGATLMTTAFSVNNPIIRLADLDTESGRNIQLGYMKIFEGAMIGIRNPKSHDNMILDRNKAIHLLFIVSFMFVKLEDSKIISMA